MIPIGARTSLADVAVAFDGSRLTLARQLSGRLKSEVAALIGKSATSVAGWETGAKRPTAATVGQLAMGLQVDPTFFVIRPERPGMHSGPPHFRSLRSTSQRARDQATAYGRLVNDIADYLEREFEFPVVDLPYFDLRSRLAEDDGPERAARLLRSQWQVAAGPIKHVLRLAENHGILAVFSRPENASVDAYSFCNHLRPTIVMNPTKRDYYRQRFDLAHELGHLVMHADAEPGGKAVEDEAHRFAAEFLMPAAEMRDILPRAVGHSLWPKLAALKEQWGVSMQALLYRARRLGCVPEVSYKNAMTTVSNRGWRRQEPGLVKLLEQPSLLPSATAMLQEEGFPATLVMDALGIPEELFLTVTSRQPRELVDSSSEQDTPSGASVVSILK